MEYVNLGDLIVAAKNNRCGDCDFPVLSITKNDGIVLQSEKFKKRIASKDTANYKIVHRGQLVQGIHIDEANFGIQEVVDIGIVSPAYKIWDIKRNAIVPKYLEVVLRSPRSIAYYASKFNGSIKRRERLSDKDLLQMRIPCPSVDEQIYAIEVLDKIIALIDSRKQQLLELDNLIKARFVELFGDPMTNPLGWPVCELSKHIRFLTSGSRGWAKYFTDTGEYFITIKNVKNCRITLDDVQHITPPDNAEAKRTRVHEGDLLISITADLGRTGVVTKEIADHGGYINQHLTCIRVNQSSVRPLYVAYYMESDAGKTQFRAKNQSAVKAGLNFNSINSLRLMVPPVELQDTFIAFVEQVDKSKVVVQRALNEAQILFDSLMQQYFS